MARGGLAADDLWHRSVTTERSSELVVARRRRSAPTAEYLSVGVAPAGAGAGVSGVFSIWIRCGRGAGERLGRGGGGARIGAWRQNDGVASLLERTRPPTLSTRDGPSGGVRAPAASRARSTGVCAVVKAAYAPVGQPAATAAAHRRPRRGKRREFLELARGARHQLALTPLRLREDRVPVHDREVLLLL